MPNLYLILRSVVTRGWSASDDRLIVEPLAVFGVVTLSRHAAVLMAAVTESTKDARRASRLMWTNSNKFQGPVDN